MSKHGESENEYLFKVNLKRRRSIWRTVLLRGDQTLDELHEAIFAAFDRYDEHLYCFYFPKARQGRLASGKPPKEYRSPRGFDRTEVFEIDNRYNAARARLDDLRLKVGQTFEYLFDFGDEWWHEIIVQGIGPSESGGTYPRIVVKRLPSPPQYPESDE
jgi:Plasmid pRiA4b ORF-3-like protein